jgi:hypothetical protein
MERYPQLYYHYMGGTFVAKQRAFESITSPDTDEELVAAVTGKRIGVFYVEIRASADAVVTFNSASTAIDAPEYVAANGGSNRGNPDNQTPLFITNFGEALTVTSTGTASVSVRVIWAPIPG